MTNVTRSNYEELLPDIISNIEASEFIGKYSCRVQNESEVN